MGFRDWLQHHDQFVMRLFKQAVEQRQYRQARNLALTVLIPQYILFVLGAMQLQAKGFDWRLIIIALATSPLGAMAFWTCQAAGFHVAARLLRSKASYAETLIVTGFSLIPNLVQLLALPLILPLSLITFLQPLAILISGIILIWYLYLLYLGQRTVHDFGSGRAVATVVLGIVVSFLALTVGASIVLSFIAR